MIAGPSLETCGRVDDTTNWGHGVPNFHIRTARESLLWKLEKGRERANIDCRAGRGNITPPAVDLADKSPLGKSETDEGSEDARGMAQL